MSGGAPKYVWGDIDLPSQVDTPGGGHLVVRVFRNENLAGATCRVQLTLAGIDCRHTKAPPEKALNRVGPLVYSHSPNKQRKRTESR